MKNLSIHVKGKVFKTGYRYHVKQMSYLFQIKGTIRYLADKSIYIEASGPPAEMDEFLRFIRIGNFSSHIEEFILKQTAPKPFRSFILLKSTVMDTGFS